MNPNYYHERFEQGGNVSFTTPAGGEIIPILNANVTKTVFPDGHELFTIIHNGIVDVFATFPIILRRD